MPPPLSGKSSGMSFMPKGSSLTKNIRRNSDENIHSVNPYSETKNFFMPDEDFNESSTSDVGSKYSYEDSADEQELYEKNIHRYILSPTHSAYESPDALEINSLVHLNSKLSTGRDISAKNSPLHMINDRNESHSLNLRKIGQPTSLKPLQPTAKKKMSPKKKSKQLKALNIMKYESDESRDTPELQNEQKSKLEVIQNEWALMQEELKRTEEAKYEQMVKEYEKKLEEEDTLIRKEHSDHLSKLKSELQQKIDEAKSAGEKDLMVIKKVNECKLIKEAQNLQEKLDSLIENNNVELSKMAEEKQKEIAEKKMQLEIKMVKEIEDLTLSHEIKIKELNESHCTELSLFEKGKEVKNPDSESIQLELDSLQKLLEEKQIERKKLTEELNQLENKVKAENESLLKLEEKNSASRTYYQEIQDEMDKVENDLDLLRTEKSAIILELNVLKENVSREKLKFQTIEQRQEKKTVNNEIHASQIYDNKGINTEQIATLSQSSQTYNDSKDAMVQVDEIKTIKHDRSLQTSKIYISGSDKACQIDLRENTNLNNKNISPTKFPNLPMNESFDLNELINNSLENTLSRITNKIDERFKVIESQMGSLSQSVKHPEREVPSSGLFNTLKINRNLESEAARNGFDLNAASNTNNKDPLMSHKSCHNLDISSQKSCGCVNGDLDNCDIMQEVKNSIYRLNDILCQSYIPSLNNCNRIPQFSQTISSYSSPLETFYTQFRQLQEKHRITNVKHSCQNEIQKQLTSTLAASSSLNQFKDIFKRKDYSKPNNIKNSNIFENGLLGDPLINACNLVMKEKARSWKQLRNSSLSETGQPEEDHLLASSNALNSVSSRTFSDFSEISHSSQYPFLSFESDPEADYNSWMKRLNTLQQRIRSHKLL